jgi:hypothetical protein
MKNNVNYLRPLTQDNLLLEIIGTLQRHKDGYIPSEYGTAAINEILRRLEGAILLEYMPMVLCYRKHNQDSSSNLEYEFSYVNESCVGIPDKIRNEEEDC